MRTILFAILLSASALTQAHNCNITASQYQVLDFSYYQGLEYDLGYTLAAIAIKESNLGDWIVNLSDPSAGYYHVTLNKVLAVKQWEDTPFNRNRAASLLTQDHVLSSELALSELSYWSNRLNSWESAVRAYNAGNGWNSERGARYLADIKTNISRIKECGWFN